MRHFEFEISPMLEDKARNLAEKNIERQFFVIINYNLISLLFTRPVLRIRIRMFLGPPDPGVLVRGLDPDPDSSIITQK